MAIDEIILKLKVEDGQLKSATAAIDKQSKALDKNTKKKKEGTKSSNRYNKSEKALYQTNLSASKGFSKMNQTMGGSSGLVAAYATLAANVFAATAAFGALSRAAQFENLKKGLQELGAQSGRTLSVMAQGLRDVTGGAISAEEAMRAAALGVSGGFGGEQLAGLAEIAKGASITLGRSLPDAFDRLTRGAIKLEPEILDELGIMVRLDDAVENYAAQIGKSAGSLTQMERRQAFMNAILEQGEQKFGDIAKAVDADPYSRLGATFGDITKNIFSFFNESMRLNKVVGFLADNIYALGGVMILFGSTIAGKMLPFLSGGAEAAAAKAAEMAKLAVATEAATAAQLEHTIASLGQFKDIGSKTGYRDKVKLLQGEEKHTVTLAELKKSLNRTEGQLMKTRDFADAKAKAAHKVRVANLKMEQTQLDAAILLEQGRGEAAFASGVMAAKANAAQMSSAIISNYVAGQATMISSIKSIGAAYTVYTSELIANATATMGQAYATSFGYTMMVRMKGAVMATTTALKILSKWILINMKWLGAIIIVITAVAVYLDKLWNTKEQKEYLKGQGELKDILEDMPNKAAAYTKAMKEAGNVADQQIRAWEITSGIITEVTDKLILQRKLRTAADESRESVTGGQDLRGESPTKFFANVLGGWEEQLAFLEELGEESAIAILNPLNSAATKFGAFDTSGVLAKEAKILGITAGEDLAQMWNVRASDEYQSYLQLMTHGTPATIEQLKRSLASIDFDAVFDAGGNMADVLFKAIQKTQRVTGLLGPAGRQLRDAFKEADKEGSKFLTTFSKKTSVDDFVRSTNGVVKGIKAVEDELKKSSGGGENLARTLDISIGKALMDVGGKVGSMLGKPFQDAQKRVKVASDALAKAQDDADFDEFGQDAKDLNKEINNASADLGIYKKNYLELNDALRKTQRLELTRKTTLAGMAKLQKYAEKNYKLIPKLAGMATKQAHQQLLFEKEIMDTKIAQIETTFDNLKLGDDEYTLAEFKALSLEEQLDIVDKLGLSTDNLMALRGADLEQALKANEIWAAQERIIHQTSLEAAEGLLTRIDAEEKLRKIKRDNLALEKANANFIRKGTTKLDSAQAAMNKIDAAQADYEFAVRRAKSEKAILDMKANLQKIDIQLLNKQIDVYNAEAAATAKKANLEAKVIERIREEDIGKKGDENYEAGAFTLIEESRNLAKQQIEEGVKGMELALTNAVYAGFAAINEAIADGMGATEAGQFFKKLFEAKTTAEASIAATGESNPELTTGGGTTDTTDTTGDKKKGWSKDQLESARGALEMMKGLNTEFLSMAENLGPEGEVFSAVTNGMFNIADSVIAIGDAGNDAEKRLAAGMKAAATIVSSISSIMASASAAKIAGIDNEIEAEKKRDGKSKQSLAKIKALEAKKEKMKKKAFEQNKKMMMAQTVINTAAAIMASLKQDGWYAIPMAILIGAMGAAQLAIISSMQYQGGGAEGGISTPTSITVGERSNKVDVSQQASAGELAYLRGARGIGTSSTAFTATGGAAGLKRGYAEGGEILVGERGPETITPLSPMQVWPSDMGAKSQINANFTIHAIDAAGVEDVLMAQQGNIINMIRSAANDHGTEFLEEVNTEMYGDTGYDFSGTNSFGGG